MEFAKKSVEILGCAALLVSTVWMTGCSDSSSETAAEDDDTRLSIQGFLANPPEPTEHFVSDDNAVIREALNKASFSFAEQVLDGPVGPLSSIDESRNRAAVTWPKLANFPLLLLPAQGATAAEHESLFARFGPTEALLGFSHLLGDTQTSGTDVSHLVWWQTGSRFEPDFLQAFNSLSVSQHYTFDFRQTGNEEAVESLLGEHYGSGFDLSLQHLADTRLISLQKMERSVEFEESGFEVEPFAGVFQRGFGQTTGVPMLRIQGLVDRFENDELVARRVSLDAAGIRLISIQLKSFSSFYHVQSNLDDVYAEMSAAWQSEQGSMILPVMSLETKLSGDELVSSDAYSEVHADLRGMDHRGGLYLQSDEYVSRFSIVQEGVQLSAVNAHAVTFSEVNESYDPNLYHGEFTAITNAPGVWICQDPVMPDLTETIVIVEDITSGLIQSVASFVELEDETLDWCYTDTLVSPITEEQLLNGSEPLSQ